MTGTVKWFNNEKGYGFITVNDMEDMFYECSSLTSIKSLKNWDVKNVKNMNNLKLALVSTKFKIVGIIDSIDSSVSILLSKSVYAGSLIKIVYSNTVEAIEEIIT